MTAEPREGTTRRTKEQSSQPVSLPASGSITIKLEDGTTIQVTVTKGNEIS